MLVALVCAGCAGGGNSAFNGKISGIVFDINGGVVRDARVWVDLPGSEDPETQTNSAGSYILENVPEGVQIVRAEVRDENNLRYYGQNMIQVFEGENSKSTNICVVRDNQLAAIKGTVRDRNGFLVAGAKVYAIGGNGLSSNYVITGEDGDYILGGLQAGITYDVSASARFFGNDEDQVNLNAAEERIINFTLNNSTDPLLPAPQNLSAIVWTSPREMTRSNELRAIEGIKRLFDPRRPTKADGRLSIGGNWIEVDLFWDPVVRNQLLGYGIYRGTTSSGPLTPIDFLRDVFAEMYIDLDEGLAENVNYYYEITALSTEYPDTNNSESDPSNRYGVTALGDLDLLPELTGPLTFRWTAARNATSYIVYVFDEYPRIDITEIWESPRTSGTDMVYTGPGLVSGRTYYYVVLGLANNDDSRTISVVESFVAP